MSSAIARAAAAFAVLAAGLSASPAVAAGATRIGPDLGSAPPPAVGCGAATCAATQLAGGAGATAPADGTLVRFSLRHGPAASALGETVRLLVLDGSGQRLRVVRQSPPFTISTQAADAVSTFRVSVPIAAGQRIGVLVQSTFAQSDSWLRVAGAAGGATVGQAAGLPVVGAAGDFAPAGDRLLLLNAELEPAAGRSGGAGRGGRATRGAARPRRGRSGNGTARPSAPVCTAAGGVVARTAAAIPLAAVRDAAAPPRRTLRLRPAAGAAAGWPARRIDASDSYNEVDAAFDRHGRLHVAARGGFRHRVIYAGPRGKKLVEATNDQGSVAIAAPRSGPVVAYGMDFPDARGGRLVYCDVLKLARGPAFRPAPVLAQRVGDTGFFFADVDADPRGTRLHAIYELGRRAPQLVYRPLGGAAQRLPLVGGTLRQARLAVRGGTVAVVARTDGALNLLVRAGRRWTRTVLARDAGVFDVAVGPDGRARVAFADDLGQLRLYTGRALVATGIPAASLGLAVDGAGRLHVALTPTARACHTTSIWDCRRGGIHHLRIDPDGRGGSAATVQETTGDAPGDLAIAVHGGAVAIAYGDPARSRMLTVRRRG